MNDAVLAIVEGRGGLVLPRAAAALGLAQRLKADFAAEADLVSLGEAGAIRGAWRTVYRAQPSPAAATIQALAGLVKRGGYFAVVVGDTAMGREIAGRLAAHLGCPVAGPVLSLRRQGDCLEATKPVDGGRRSARLGLRKGPVLLVADPAGAGERQSVGQGSPLEASLAVGDLDSPFVVDSERRLSAWDIDVSQAEVVVAGGRGVGGREGFEMLAELAGLLGGAIGASRVAVDAGWAPRSCQVGLSGKTVAPRLYVACGISGAVHHTLGMRDSAVVIAINSDPKAPIHQMADVSMVGDLRLLLPALISEVRSRRPSPLSAGLGAGPR